ncbi:hypothetical protein [Streptomyces sp. C184]|uniref:hypothetical protein n=1 Tax=Streptomyces sp. C184 TaxID=3237121 RepID=UPI0034C61C80
MALEVEKGPAGDIADLRDLEVTRHIPDPPESVLIVIITRGVEGDALVPPRTMGLPPVVRARTWSHSAKLSTAW